MSKKRVLYFIGLTIILIIVVIMLCGCSVKKEMDALKDMDMYTFTTRTDVAEIVAKRTYTYGEYLIIPITIANTSKETLDFSTEKDKFVMQTQTGETFEAETYVDPVMFYNNESQTLINLTSVKPKKSVSGYLVFKCAKYSGRLYFRNQEIYFSVPDIIIG